MDQFLIFLIAYLCSVIIAFLFTGTGMRLHGRLMVRWDQWLAEDEWDEKSRRMLLIFTVAGPVGIGVGIVVWIDILNEWLRHLYRLKSAKNCMKVPRDFEGSDSNEQW